MEYYQIPIYCSGVFFIYLSGSMVIDYMVISYQKYRNEITKY